MLSPKASRWLGALILLMLVLRVGTKYYRQQQRPTAEEQMQQALIRQEALLKTLEADQQNQRAKGARVVLADSTIAASDTASSVKITH